MGSIRMEANNEIVGYYLCDTQGSYKVGTALGEIRTAVLDVSLAD